MTVGSPRGEEGPVQDNRSMLRPTPPVAALRYGENERVDTLIYNRDADG